MFRTVFARSLGIAFAALLAAPLVCVQTARAQEPPPVRIRGTIERVDGAIYVVKARDGAELKLTLADKPQIAGIIKASLSDIKQNSFVGVTAMPQPDGSLSAVEVHIFPETMRGTGEGHYPWDLQPHALQQLMSLGRTAASTMRPAHRQPSSVARDVPNAGLIYFTRRRLTLRCCDVTRRRMRCDRLKDSDVAACSLVISLAN
jgi:hypothetical protein